MQYNYQDFIIEIFEDQTYTRRSTDNALMYTKEYFGEEGREYPVSQYGIKVLRENKEVSSCIIIASGGKTSVGEHTVILENGKLFIACGDSIFCLTVPDLDLVWVLKADEATCFGIFKLQKDFVIHGECEISRITQEGKKKWKVKGDDIFVSQDAEKDFKIEKENILVYDFEEREYKIDFQGKLRKLIF